MSGKLKDGFGDRRWDRLKRHKLDANLIRNPLFGRRDLVRQKRIVIRAGEIQL